MLLKLSGNPVQPDQSIRPNSPITPLLQAAASIYATYYKSSSEAAQKPYGIAVHRVHFRGKLIFAQKPILLPEECFFPIEQIETLQSFNKGTQDYPCSQSL